MWKSPNLNRTSSHLVQFVKFSPDIPKLRMQQEDVCYYACTDCKYISVKALQTNLPNGQQLGVKLRKRKRHSLDLHQMPFPFSSTAPLPLCAATVSQNETFMSRLLQKH